jgi:ribonucleoside-diphosphate reductase alpha chain
MTRKHLPETRHSVTRRVPHLTDLDIYVVVGFFEDGEPGEIFIKLGKEGSTLRGLLDIIGLLMSQALQYGISWEQISKNIRNTNFEPRDSDGFSIGHTVVLAVDEILKCLE